MSYDYKTAAGLRKLVALGLIKRDELAVAFITGVGLKTQGGVAERTHPLVIQRTLESFEEVLVSELQSVICNACYNSNSRRSTRTTVWSSEE